MTYKLGKLPPRPDERDFHLSAYLRKPLPTPPAEFGKDISMHWKMLGNDKFGCCVFAGGAHETMLWTKEGGKFSDFEERGVLADYAEVTGFDPRTGNNDDGTVVRDAMKYRRKRGLLDRDGIRHRIEAYVSMRKDTEVMKAATWIFDAVGIGFEVPSYAMDQFRRGKPWDVKPGKATIEGGHYVPVVGFYDGMFACVTWGKIQMMTVPFFEKFTDERWAMLTREFLNAEGKSPDGFDIRALKDDLSKTK